MPMRASLGVLIVLASMLTFMLPRMAVQAAPARSDEEAKKTCGAAFAHGQRLMRDGKLLEATKQLVLCGGAQCPAVMQADCQHWLTGVEQSTPTVVFQVTATAGRVPPDVGLSIDDGELRALDSRAVAMDPGAHDVTIVANGFVTVHAHLVVTEGEKLHRVAVALAPAMVEAPPAEAAPVRPAVDRREQASSMVVPVALASTGAALAGAAALYFGLKARADDRDLDHCSPNCSTSSVNDVKREYLWTNVSIGVAAAGVTAGVVLLLVGGHSAKPAKTETAWLEITAGPRGFGTTLTAHY